MARFAILSVLVATLCVGCSKNADFADDKNPPGVRTFGPPSK